MAISDLVRKGAQTGPQLREQLIEARPNGIACTCFWGAALIGAGCSVEELVMLDSIDHDEDDWEPLTVEGVLEKLEEPLGKLPYYTLDLEDSAIVDAALGKLVVAGFDPATDSTPDLFEGDTLVTLGVYLNDDLGLTREQIADIFALIGQ